MHAKIRSGLLSFITAFALLPASGSMANSDVQVETFKKSLSSVPAPEIPARAASLVAQSKAEDRQAVAVSIVTAAMELSPATAPELVGAIARKFHVVSPEIAAVAVAKQPKMAALIAKAAALSAPDYAGQIVAAICKKEPAAYAEVGLEVARALPHAGNSVLAGMLEAIPNLKPFVDWATAKAGPAPSRMLPYLPAIVEKTARAEGVTISQLLKKGISAKGAIQLASTSGQLSPASDLSSVAGDTKPGDTRSAAFTQPPRNHDYSTP